MSKLTFQLKESKGWDRKKPEAIVATSFQLPAALYSRMADRARFHGVTMKALVVEAIERLLRTEDEENPIPPDDQSM